MTTFRNPYHTTVGSAAMMNKTIDAIKESMVKDSLHNYTLGTHNEDVPVFFILGNNSSEDNIPFFAHPLEINVRDSQTRDMKTYICGDMRLLITKSGRDVERSFRIRNQSEYMIAYVRTVLSSIWLSERPTLMRDISYIPTAVFASWISEAVTRRYAFDAKDQLGLSVLAAIYYQTLFIGEINEDNKNKIAQAVMIATKAPSNMVFEYIEKIDKMNDIKDFCHWARTLLENPRLDDFNEGILITILGNTWYGANAKEVVAIALEHPPTWLTLVFYSFTERSYKNSIIAKISSRYMSKGKGEEEFIKGTLALIRQYADLSVATNF